ncbi:cupin domain-containing protein [Actinoplanes sp. Pm04-4]|uniref:Cupin domain-containing protein n=1 Tax=Paractinoplanes pyxinae TaxID=2997416 RepID=A0ABT4ARY0_9ACTN|nr:cupin domain-containing protein [Actinoplanes pyxinae]MCY1136587.1 cupin domain-containing protein [Actinoplanes pyxinae]
MSDLPFWFLGGQVRVLVPGEATGGAVSVMEFTDIAGHAPPMHIHDNEDEVWIVLDGKVSFFVGDQKFDLEPGQAAHGPRGVAHSYLVRSDKAKLAAVFAPGHVENWFTGNGSPVANVDDAPAEFDIGAILASADTYRVHVAGPPPIG